MLASLVVAAVLLALLIPMIRTARSTAQTAVCSSNLSQIGRAWQLYFNAHGTFPPDLSDADWEYGGVERTEDGYALARSRPINAYMSVGEEDEQSAVGVFRCPSDTGVYRMNRIGQRVPVLRRDSCFEEFGTSYRSNRFLVDPVLARGGGVDPTPLRLHEVQVWAERLLLAGDAEWYYATRKPGEPESDLDASWHGTPRMGNMLALDGSVRLVRFRPGESSEYLLYHYPRPQ